MKASEVIARLTELVEKHGDKEVRYDGLDPFDDVVKSISPYDGNGNPPSDEEYLGAVIEFFIH